MCPLSPFLSVVLMEEVRGIWVRACGRTQRWSMHRTLGLPGKIKFTRSQFTLALYVISQRCGLSVNPWQLPVPLNAQRSVVVTALHVTVSKCGLRISSTVGGAFHCTNAHPHTNTHAHTIQIPLFLSHHCLPFPISTTNQTLWLHIINAHFTVCHTASPVLLWTWDALFWGIQAWVQDQDDNWILPCDKTILCDESSMFILWNQIQVGVVVVFWGKWKQILLCHSLQWDDSLLTEQDDIKKKIPWQISKMIWRIITNPLQISLKSNPKWSS